VGVDLVLDGQLLGLAPADVGLGLVIGDHQLDHAAVDAAGFVDPIHGHLGSDQGRLAAGGCRAAERLERTDLEGLGLPERAPPRRRHQHAGAQRAGGGRAEAE